MAARRPPQALAGARPQDRRRPHDSRTAAEAGRRDDRELPAAGARTAAAALGRHRADQPAPRLLLAHRLRRERPRPRPAGLRHHRLFRPLRHPRRGALRRRAARRLAAGAGRPRDRDDARRRDPDGPAAARPDRQGRLGRHVALRQRRLGQWHDGRRRAGRRGTPGASAPRQAAQRADQSLPHARRSLAAAPDGARRPALGHVLRHRGAPRPDCRSALQRTAGTARPCPGIARPAGAGIRQPPLCGLGEAPVGHRHPLRRDRPAGRRGRRRAGRACRNLRGYRQPRDPADREHTDPPGLRHAAQGRAAARGRPAQ